MLVQYYSVLHSSTPVLLCTTRYYSTTTLYYKVLLQYHYYSVLQSTTPVLLCTTKCYSVLQNTSPTTLYYKVTLISNPVTDETLFTMRGATINTLQPHQILRLARKMTSTDKRKFVRKLLKCHFQCATDPTMKRE